MGGCFYMKIDEVFLYGGFNVKGCCYWMVYFKEIKILVRSLFYLLLFIIIISLLYIKLIQYNYNIYKIINYNFYKINNCNI